MRNNNEKKNIHLFRCRLSKHTANTAFTDEDFHYYRESWINDSDELLRESIRDLIISEEDVLPESLLSEWEDLITEYFGSYSQTATSVHSYLSQPREFLMNVYGESDILRRYIDRLFRILNTHFIAKERHFMHNGKEITSFKDQKGRTVHVIEDDHGELSTVTELLENDIVYFEKLKKGEISSNEMSELWG